MRPFLVYLIIAALLMVGPAHAAPEHAPPALPMVGGEFVDLVSSPIALVLTPSNRCSGVLVSPRHVLTAAHCLVNGYPNEHHLVIVGRRATVVATRWIQSFYQPGGNSVLNAPFDLGMVLLSEPISTVSPVPVLFDAPVGDGATAFMFGYGSHEIPASAGRYPWEDGKRATVRIEDARAGLLASRHGGADASACPGDSGGPLMQRLGSLEVAIGILSIGTNRVENGTCVVTDGGFFAYVDLQSPLSQRFVRSFPGVHIVSGVELALSQNATRIRRQLLRAARSHSLRRLRRSAAVHLRDLPPRSTGFSLPGQRGLIAARRTLRRVARAPNLRAAQRTLPQALRALRRLRRAPLVQTVPEPTT